MQTEANIDISSSSSSSSSTSSSSSEEDSLVSPWAILVAFSSFLCLALAYGSMAAAPIYMSHLVVTLKTSIYLASFPGALMQGCSLIAGPFASMMTVRLGFRKVTIIGSLISAAGYSLAYFSTSLVHLCIFQGVVGGIGCGLVILPATVVINYYFPPKWRSLVTCVCLCGISAGAMLFPLVLKTLLDLDAGSDVDDVDKAALGVTGAETGNWVYFLIGQGGVMLSGCVFGLAFRPIKTFGPKGGDFDSSSSSSSSSSDEEDAAKKTEGAASSPKHPADISPARCCRRCRCSNWVRSANLTLSDGFDIKLLRSPTFIIVTVSGTIKSLVAYVPNVYMTQRLQVAGTEKWATDSILAIIGFSGMLGRIFCGLISGLDRVDTTVEQNIALLFAGAISLVSAYVDDTVGFLVFYGFAYGFCQGVFNSLRTLMLVDLLGLERLNSAFGLSSLFQGFPLMVGPVLAGSLSQGGKNMNDMFVLTGSLLIVSAVICFPLNRINRWERAREARLQAGAVETVVLPTVPVSDGRSSVSDGRSSVSERKPSNSSDRSKSSSV